MRLKERSENPPLFRNPSRDLHHPKTATMSQNRSDESTLGQYIPLLYHYNMLQDDDRVGAFLNAIEFAVQPGMNVVELGGGTGILSSFAARIGANVTYVERNPDLVSIAHGFLRNNGLSGHVDIVQCDAMSFTPETPTDVVICEMLHVGLLREKQAQVIDAFKANYKSRFPDHMPLFIPEVSMLLAQLIHQSFDFYGFDAPLPMFQAPVMGQIRTTELSKFQTYANIDYRELIPQRFEQSIAFEMEIPGTVNAIRFATQNILAVNLAEQQAITWPNQCLVLPIQNPIQVKTGDKAHLSIAYDAGGSVESLWQSLDFIGPEE
jgi:protein arginine N-methyltransferase 1